MFWTRLYDSLIGLSDGKDSEKARRSLNVNEEYLCALRTKSYADFFTKAQLLVKQPSSPSNYCHVKFSEVLLEPGQDTIADILESAILSKKPELKGLILNYFDMSAEASKICSHLLKSISQLLANYQFIERIRDKYSIGIAPSKIKRKSVARKIKLIKYFKKASGVFVTVGFGLVAVTAMVIAAHTLTALLMGPAIFSFPIKRFKKKLLDARFLRSGLLRKVGQQLDVAAKGTYILNRDFDTMSRLVARLHDEVEHNKE
ncbi:UPF0496 protein 3 [Vitis vinifera]|uniref:UPF0496 protein 3 n=1 Tax=Vitis vinifera TaxID=29760 RepID=A0A438EMR2_VITVI|nr:UPF0496 protein 3 [Vitis vinifera]